MEEALFALAYLRVIKKTFSFQTLTKNRKDAII